MALLFPMLLADKPGHTRTRIVALYGFLLAGNGAAWLWAVMAFRHYPMLMGTAFLAYSFGLRHAVDADHIAAIDNVTRKLMQQKQRPIAVGLLFSLGHSTVVVVGSIVIAVAALSLQQRIAGVRAIGAILGTSVSSIFLLALGTVNVVVLWSTCQAFLKVRRGEPYEAEDLNVLLSGSGLLARLFRPVFRMVRSSWHMYPLGILFGLGFDTATEIGLLGISAGEAAKGLSLWSILVFPVLFAAGMALIDTTDNVLMLGAYGWAFLKPVRKLYYNITITFVSVLVAFAVGGVEMLGLLGAQLHRQGTFWHLISRLNDHFGLLGYWIVGLFAVSWLIAIALYKWHDFDRLELRA